MESRFRILTLEKLGAIFNQEIRKLPMTPRRVMIHPEMSWLYILESDHLSYTEINKQKRREQLAKVCCTFFLFSAGQVKLSRTNSIVQDMVDAADDKDKETMKEAANAILSEKLDEETFGSPKASNGMWAARIRLMNPITGHMKVLYEFEQNESAIW